MIMLSGTAISICELFTNLVITAILWGECINIYFVREDTETSDEEVAKLSRRWNEVNGLELDSEPHCLGSDPSSAL